MSRMKANSIWSPVVRLRPAAVAVAACFSTAGYALPVSPVVVNGSEFLRRVGNVLTVTNSNGAVIDWQKFGISAGEVTRFIQPSASSWKS